MMKSMIAVAVLIGAAGLAPAFAQMGGDMPAGGRAAQGSSPFDKGKTMTGADKKKWAACQEMTEEARKADRKCAMLQKKAERSGEWK